MAKITVKKKKEISFSRSFVVMVPCDVQQTAGPTQQQARHRSREATLVKRNTQARGVPLANVPEITASGHNH